MILLIDSGNTKVKFANFDGEKVESTTFFAAREELYKYSGLIYCSVSEQQELTDILALAVKSNIRITKAEVSPIQFDVVCAYPNFKNLGIDRWLAILGARGLYPNQPLIIVDAGTAMTVDVIEASGQHIGGWIMPGLALLQSSISEKAPLVFGSDDIKKELFGTDTPSALYRGCISALCGAIEKAQQDLLLESSTSFSPTIILTGGDAKTIASELNSTLVIRADLVFLGLCRFI